MDKSFLWASSLYSSTGSPSVLRKTCTLFFNTTLHLVFWDLFHDLSSRRSSSPDLGSIVLFVFALGNQLWMIYVDVNYFSNFFLLVGEWDSSMDASPSLVGTKHGR